MTVITDAVALPATRFELDDVLRINWAICAGRGCEWLQGVYLEGPVRIPFFADGTRQLLQAPVHITFTHGSSSKEPQPNRLPEPLSSVSPD